MEFFFHNRFRPGVADMRGCDAFGRTADPASQAEAGRVERQPGARDGAGEGAAVDRPVRGENPVLRPHADDAGAFEVISGSHRLRLYVELGMDSAPCHVVELDDGTRLLAQT